MMLKWEVTVLFFLQKWFLESVHGQCSGHQYIQVNYVGFIQSPDLDSGNYPVNQNCSWHIEGSPNGTYLFYRRYGIDCTDSLTVYEGCDETGPLWVSSTCGGDAKKSGDISGGSIFARFISDNETTDKGFALFYTSGSPENVGTACDGGYTLTANSSTQYFTSPDFPKKYPKNVNCMWNITGENGKSVKLEIMFVDVEADGCQYDYLRVSNGDGIELDKICETNSWQLRTYLNDSFSVFLFSDNDVNQHGFVISFITLEEETTTDTATTTTTTQSPECNYPLAWQTNTMTDSVKGTVNFTATTLSGWIETSYGVSLDEWTCYQRNGNLIVSRSLNTVPTIENYYVFMCLQIIDVANNVYTYKLISAENSDSMNARIVPITESTSPSFPSQCNEESHNDTRTLTFEVEETTTTQEETTTYPVTTTVLETTTQQETTTSTISNSASTRPETTTESQECNYPLAWQTNTMTDSVKGNVNFTATTLSGWIETSFGVSLDEWTCYQRNGNLIVSRSLNTVPTIANYYVFMCLQIIDVANNVYTYKLISAENSDSMNARVVPITESTTPSFPSSCNEENHNNTRTLMYQAEESTTTEEVTTTGLETTTVLQTTSASQTSSKTESTTGKKTTTVLQTTSESQTSSKTESTTGKATTTSTLIATTPQTTTDIFSTTNTQHTADLSSTTDTQTTTDSPSTTNTQTTTDSPSTTNTQTTTDSPSTTNTQTTTDSQSTANTKITTDSLIATNTQSTTDFQSTKYTQSTSGSPNTMDTQTTTDFSSTTKVQTTSHSPSTTTTQTTTDTLSTTKNEQTSDPTSITKTEITTDSSPNVTEVETTTDNESTAKPPTTAVQRSTLSPGAQIAVVSGVVGGLSALFLLGALVVIIIFAYGKKPIKKNYRKDSDASTDHQFRGRNDDSRESVPAWISMIDSLKEGYNPYFFNDQKSGKWSGDKLHQV